MQASRALIAMLVLVASAFMPVLSTPIELEARQCVVVPFIFCNTADLFVILVEGAKWKHARKRIESRYIAGEE
jgi:hypothetical protein